MKITRRRFALWVLSTLTLPAAVARAAAAGALTTITVTDMHCANCARKIARKLFTVPGVVKVATNVSANTAIVMPQADRAPSPRAMWEAVEQSGFKPVSLEGPSGRFTAKPTE